MEKFLKLRQMYLFSYHEKFYQIDWDVVFMQRAE